MAVMGTGRSMAGAIMAGDMEVVVDSGGSVGVVLGAITGIEDIMADIMVVGGVTQ